MKKNKPIAGYHLLMILSAVDGKFSIKEDLVIERWLEEEMPLRVNLDKETEALSALKQEDYMIHFQKCMADFYEDSTEQERNAFIKYAIELAQADKRITPEENIFINELFNEWTETSID
ncbi:MAG: TerB family tellurite resistance protein [Chitinophagales bacterium]